MVHNLTRVVSVFYVDIVEAGPVASILLSMSPA
jgi:hypothetical protein